MDKLKFVSPRSIIGANNIQSSNQLNLIGHELVRNFVSQVIIFSAICESKP